MIYSRRYRLSVDLFLLFLLVGIGVGESVLLSQNSLKWEGGEGFRSAKLNVPISGKVGFELIESKLAGIGFENALPTAEYEKNLNLLNGSGLALGDVDGDGLCDVYFCGLGGANALYRNLGSWRFQDVTASSGTAAEGAYSRGAVFADIDGDTDQDLIVSFSGLGVRVYENDGSGKFTDRQLKPLAARTGASSMALADVDNDGDLDLYVANYGIQTIRNGAQLSFRRRGKSTVVTGRWRNRVRVIDGVIVEFGEPDRFYRNDGDGNFELVSWTDGHFLDEEGKKLPKEYWDLGLSVMFRDINRDSHPDIYVCNDFQQPDRIWLNDGRGRFQAISRGAIRLSSYYSMGVDFADFNRDGFDDFFVADMMSRSHSLRIKQGSPNSPPISETLEAVLDRPQLRRNTAYFNRGDGTYAEGAQLLGLEASDWAWCPAFLDVDLDGFEDLLVVNGYSADANDLDTSEFNARWPKNSPRRKKFSEFPALITPNVAFKNVEGKRFEEVGENWGFNSTQISHGMGLADMDNDGDLDVLVNCLHAAPLIYRNTASEGRVAVRLKGINGNSAGVGARITLKGGPFDQAQEVIAGGRYLSSDGMVRTFAAGDSGQNRSLEVLWRSGLRSVIPNIQTNRIYEIWESDASRRNVAEVSEVNETFFEDQRQLLGDQHEDSALSDFQRQASLSHSLSFLGPGVGWIDLDGDRDDDLVVGTGQGGQLREYINDGEGRFRRRGKAGSASETLDLTAVVALGSTEDGASFVVGRSNYDRRRKAEPSTIRFYGGDGTGAELSLPDESVSVGPLAVGDLDHDGDLDLVVGGRCSPGRFPVAVSSYVFKNDAGVFHLDECSSRALDKIGMASGLVLSDINSDGWLDLIVACSWGPIRIFVNEAGCFSELRDARGLLRYRGLWNGVATADFNGDGRMDIVASNWGRNHRFTPHDAKPIRLEYGDLQGDGVIEIVEGYYSGLLDDWVPFRMLDLQQQVFPEIRSQFATHAAYSEASMQSLWGEGTLLGRIDVETFESMVFLNNGDGFEAKPLPLAVQLAPSFAVCPADFDSDGIQDLFVSQNFSRTSAENAPLMEGKGVLLRGDGDGNFQAVAGEKSGLMINGDQRGAAVGDYDRDGRADLVVTQNNGATRLFRNRWGQAGRLVRLEGSAGNPAAIGASLRIVRGNQKGPVLEVQSGSGYWSQNSFGQILPKVPKGERPLEIWVRWPEGSEATYSLPPGDQHLRLSQEQGFLPAKRVR